MKKIGFAAIIIMLIVLACGGKEKIVDGKTIYKKNCVICHGAKGNMGANGAYNLTISELSLQERVHVITNGRKAMAPYKNILTKEQIAAVAAYTESLSEVE